MYKELVPSWPPYNRFIIFLYYYNEGYAIQEDFNTLDEAKAHVKHTVKSREEYKIINDCDYSVFDCDARRFVWRYTQD